MCRCAREMKADTLQRKKRCVQRHAKVGRKQLACGMNGTNSQRNVGHPCSYAGFVDVDLLGEHPPVKCGLAVWWQ